MDKPLWASKTMQGGVLAALSELVRAWAVVFGWNSATVHAALATVTTLGLLWSLWGLRSAAGSRSGPGAGSVMLVLTVLLLAAGCTRTCQVVRWRIEAHPDGQPAPAGKVVLLCDGEPIVEQATGDVGLPKCAP